MKMIKLLILLLTVICFAPALTAAQAKIITLYEDDYAGQETASIKIVRDAKGYAELRKIIPDLPAVETIDFKKTAIVAAFAGQKPTSGYEINVSGAANNLKINLIAPPKDAISLQVLTAPVKVVAVPVKKGKKVTISKGKSWK